MAERQAFPWNSFTKFSDSTTTHGRGSHRHAAMGGICPPIGRGGQKGRGQSLHWGGDLHINFPILWKLLLQSNTVNSVFSTKKNDYPSVGGGPPYWETLHRCMVGQGCHYLYVNMGVTKILGIGKIIRTNYKNLKRLTRLGSKVFSLESF